MPGRQSELARPDRYSTGNTLIDALPATDLAEMADDLEIIDIPAREYTNSAGGVMAFVDFPIDAVMSVVATLKNGDAVEVGTVGRESFVEYDAALDATRSSRASFCQVSGRVGRMHIHRFRHRMSTSATFARMMRHNVRASLFNVQQFSACNVKHSLLQRCARWLAMTADRVGRPQFGLTHDFLAIMLGVRRAGVSEAANALYALGAIEYTRGLVTIVDRTILEQTACECYAACKLAYESSF